MNAPPRHPIVFFDGLCILCNGLVDRLLRWDRKGVLRFATLQGETAQRLLDPGVAGNCVGETPVTGSDPGTVVLVDGRGISHRSEAVLRALAHLGGAWSGVAVLHVVPRPARDAIYRYVAARRYRWFGRQDVCRAPSTAEQDRFLP